MSFSNSFMRFCGTCVTMSNDYRSSIVASLGHWLKTDVLLCYYVWCNQLLVYCSWCKFYILPRDSSFLLLFGYVNNYSSCLGILGCYLQYDFVAIYCYWYSRLAVQMCEQAAEAQKSKGTIARRGRTSSDPTGNNRDSISVDAILSKNSSTSFLVSSI